LTKRLGARAESLQRSYNRGIVIANDVGHLERSPPELRNCASSAGVLVLYAQPIGSARFEESRGDVRTSSVIAPIVDDQLLVEKDSNARIRSRSKDMESGGIGLDQASPPHGEFWRKTVPCIVLAQPIEVDPLVHTVEDCSAREREVRKIFAAQSLDQIPESILVLKMRGPELPTPTPK